MALDYVLFVEVTALQRIHIPPKSSVVQVAMVVGVVNIVLVLVNVPNVAGVDICKIVYSKNRVEYEEIIGTPYHHVRVFLCPGRIRGY